MLRLRSPLRRRSRRCACGCGSRRVLPSTRRRASPSPPARDRRSSSARCLSRSASSATSTRARRRCRRPIPTPAIPTARPPDARRRFPNRRTCGMYVRPAVSIVFTEPPPPMPSTRRMCGRRSSSARPSARCRLPAIDASAEPPRTVKSSPERITGRPPISAVPSTKFDGVNARNSPFGVVVADAGQRADLVERCRDR